MSSGMAAAPQPVSDPASLPRTLARAQLFRAILTHAGALTLFVAVTIAVRGQTISVWTLLNPDEAELMAQARAAQHSVLPFTTWTMGTTGPFWPMFLSLLGGLGLPLTIVFAHLLAACAVGVMGYAVWVLMRRTVGPVWGTASAVLWWLPIALIYPIGSTTDFGALSTELLPAVLILGAALVPSRALTASPWLFVVPGLLSGLAVGAKYQAAPVVLALVVVQLVSARVRGRAAVASLAWWCGAAAFPIVVVVAALAISPSVSIDLVRETVSFLGSYADRVDLFTRAENLVRLLSTQPYLAVVAIFVIRLCFVSSRRVVLLRGLLVAGGLLAVAAGGMVFGHYLWFVYVSVALAASLPIAEGSELVPWRATRRLSLPVAGAVAVAVIVAGFSLGKLSTTDMGSVRDAVRSDSVPRDSTVLALCPVGSDVLVWGWASELYVNYSWNNTVPFMNTLGLRSTPENLETARPLVSQSIAKSDCVVDASGPPFFGSDPSATLESVYPDFAAVLNEDFTAKRGVLDCESCTLYVRN